MLWFQPTVDPTCFVPPDNAADVVDLIQELVDSQLTGTGELDGSELESVVKKLSEVVNVSLVEPPVATEIMGIVADILLSDTDVAPLADMWVGRRPIPANAVTDGRHSARPRINLSFFLY